MTTKPKAKKKKATQKEAVDPFRVVRREHAQNYSGRPIGFEVGHDPDSDTVALRLVWNEGSGTFSKEWVALAAIRKSIPKAAAKGETFHPGKAVQQSYVGKSKNNGPFLAHVIRHEGLVEQSEDKPSHVVLAGDWEAWEKAQKALPTMPPPEPEAADEQDENGEAESPEEPDAQAAESEEPETPADAAEKATEEAPPTKGKTRRGRRKPEIGED